MIQLRNKLVIAVTCLFMFLAACTNQASKDKNAGVDKNGGSTNEIQEVKVDWDSIPAFQPFEQEKVLPASTDLVEYPILKAFSDSDPASQALTKLDPEGWNDVQPKNCLTVWGYVFVGSLYETAESEFSNSLGTGWENVFRTPTKTFAARVIADQGKRDIPIIDLLVYEVNSCPSITYVIKKDDGSLEIWTLSYRINVNEDGSATIRGNMKTNTNFSGYSLMHVKQFGRNLVSGLYSQFTRGGVSPDPIRSVHRKDVVGIVQSIGDEISAIANSSN